MDISMLNQEGGYRAWVKFGDDVEVLIAHVDREEMRKILKKATTTKYVKHQEVEDFDPILADELLARKAVLGWRDPQAPDDPQKTGFMNGSEPFPWSEDHAVTLMRGYVPFARFVNRMASDLDALVEAAKADEKKPS